jgi:hypothetical protein
MIGPCESLFDDLQRIAKILGRINGLNAGFNQNCLSRLNVTGRLAHERNNRK